MPVRRTAAQLVAAGLTAALLAAMASPGLAGVGPDQSAQPANPTKSSAPVAGWAAPIGDATELLNGVEVTAPKGRTAYAYTQSVIYWSVTAARPDSGKPTLWLYADEDNTDLLAESSTRGAKIEFVAVDTNHAPAPTTYFPTVRSKDGTSTVELDNAAGIIFDDNPDEFTLSADDVVIVTDVFLDDGVTYKLTVTGPANGDPDLFVMRSAEAEEDSWYQARTDAFAKAGKRPAGEKEKITITGDGSWHGLVLIQQSGSGTYTVKKSPIL